MSAACVMTTLLCAVGALAVLVHLLHGLLIWMWAVVRTLAVTTVASVVVGVVLWAMASSRHLEL